MSIIINNINSPVSEGSDPVIEKALKKAKLKQTDTIKTGIYKTSLDARKRSDIHFVHSVYADLGNAALEKKLCEKDPSLQYIDSEVAKPVINTEDYKGRIAIVGFGPAGLFCALVLSENGYKQVESKYSRHACPAKYASENRF